MRLRSMVLGWALFCAGSAHAQLAELPANAGRFSLGGSLGYFSDTQAASSLDVATLRASALYGFSERFALQADAGFVLLGSSPERGPGDLAFRPGNPAVLGWLLGQWGALRYRVGLGGSGPLATIDRDDGGRLQRAALNYASGLSGLWDAWLWAPDRSAALLRAVLEAPLLDKTWLDVTVAPALFIPSRTAWGHDDLDVFVPLSLSLGARHAVVWYGGLAQVVWMPTASPDADQVAIGPWLRVVLGDAFVQARALFNVDEPLAGTRGPGVRALHLEGGGVL